MRRPGKAEAPQSDKDVANARLVLDSNEYIYALGPDRAPSCVALIELIAGRAGSVAISVNRTIVDEVSRNVRGPDMRRCHRFWRALNVRIDGDSGIPASVLNKYLARGLKPADAQIAAYAESAGANVLISENRDFLALVSPLPFRIMKAAAFLKEFNRRKPAGGR